MFGGRNKQNVGNTWIFPTKSFKKEKVHNVRKPRIYSTDICRKNKTPCNKYEGRNIGNKIESRNWK